MKQIVVVCEDRVGVVADISKVLSDQNINIDEIDTVVIESHAVVIIATEKYDAALHALKEASFTAVTEDAFIIKIKDEPGSLAKVAGRFKDANVSIRSMHIIRRAEGYSLVALAAEKTDEARDLIKDVLIA